MEKARGRINIINRIREMDLTKGNLFWKLGLFALPIALTTILQLLYTTVDLVSVHFWGGGESSASAISGNGALINLVVIFFMAFSIGSNIAIGNAMGAKQKEHANKILHTSMIFALFLGIIVGVVAFFLTPWMLEIINIEPGYLEDATTYLRLYFLGLPLLMVYNYGAQIHRAIGDSATPFLILLVSGLCNVIADFIFVYFFHLNVAGVAYATIISEAISAILICVSLFVRKDAYVRLKWKELKIDKEALLEIVKLGAPAGLQGLCFSLPNTFIQSALYSIGAGNIDLQNGAIAANSLNNYFYAFVEAITASTMAITAINYGAKNKENIKKALYYGLIWGIAIYALYVISILSASRLLLSIFVDFDNEEAIKAGQMRLAIVGFTYILDCVMDVLSGSMKGVRHPIVPAIVILITCTVFRLVYIQFFVLSLKTMRNVFWLYAAYPFSWVLACLAEGIVIPFVWRKEFRKMDCLAFQTSQNGGTGLKYAHGRMVSTKQEDHR